jgi:HK97 family phage major capsid protein
MSYFERKSADDVLDRPAVPAELTRLLGGVKEALQQLDSKAEDTKTNALKALEQYEIINAKYAQDKAEYDKRVAAAEKKSAEAEKRVMDLETAIATKGGRNKVDEKEDRDSPEWKAFWGAMETGEVKQGFWQSGATAEVKRLMRTDRDSDGGFLVPTPTEASIRKKIVEISPVSAYATTRMMTGKAMNVVVRKALAESFYEGEAEPDEEGGTIYGTETVTAFRHSHTVPITYDQLRMSPFDMEMEIASDVGQVFAKKRSRTHVRGTGIKQPEGIFSRPDVERILTAGTNAVTWDDIANLFGAMKTGYNPMFFFNRRTFAKLVQIKDSQNRPLWQPVAGEKPATIWDHPYTSSFIDMDDMGASGAEPILFADLAAGYEIFELMGMTAVRDDVTKKRQAIVEFTFRMYDTAKVIMPEPIKILKVR